MSQPSRSMLEVTITDSVIKKAIKVLNSALTVTENFTKISVIQKVLSDIINILDLSVCDSYSEGANEIEFLADKYGQSFTGDGKILDSCKFCLYRGYLTTGTIVAKVYAHTGTFGVDGVPTGSPLATSEIVDVSIFSYIDFESITFNFTGANKITLANGTKYCVVLEPTLTDVLFLKYDGNSPTHSGNLVLYISSWTAHSDKDLVFYVRLLFVFLIFLFL